MTDTLPEIAYKWGWDSWNLLSASATDAELGVFGAIDKVQNSEYGQFLVAWCAEQEESYALWMFCLLGVIDAYGAEAGHERSFGDSLQRAQGNETMAEALSSIRDRYC